MLFTSSKICPKMKKLILLYNQFKWALRIQYGRRIFQRFACRWIFKVKFHSIPESVKIVFHEGSSKEEDGMNNFRNGEIIIKIRHHTRNVTNKHTKKLSIRFTPHPHKSSQELLHDYFRTSSTPSCIHTWLTALQQSL